MKNTRRSLIALITGVSLSASAMSSPSPANIAPKTIFGLSEYVYIEELGVGYKAKIDTGAESASLNAINAKVEESDSDDKPDMVHFDLVLPSGDLRAVSLPLEKHIRIIRRAGDMDDDDKYYHRRPVLEMTLCIGGEYHRTEVNLADRRQFSKAMLIGARPITAFNAMVDPSAEYLQDQNACKQRDNKSNKERAE